jgi:hypothetical protein
MKRTRMADEVENRSRHFFSSGIVREESREKGVYRALNRERITDVIHGRAVHIRITTQNPLVDLSLRRTLDAWVQKKQSPITAYAIAYEPMVHSGRKPVAAIPQPRSGVAEIDERYRTLDYENGEMFALTVTITYKK